MITYEIRKPYARPLISKVQRILNGRKPHVVVPNTESASYMGKLEFAQWIEELKKEIKPGDLMTLASLEYKPDVIPTPLFKVYALQEIHWNAPIGNVHGQPRAVMCNSLSAPEIICTYEPKLLRKLNYKEVELVYLQHNQREATDFDATDEEVSWDVTRQAFVKRNKDGVIIKEYPRNKS